jgi:hypothetical protein
MGKLSFAGFLARFAAALLLVLATFNPTGLSFISWLAASFPHIQPLQAVVGVALQAVWIFFGHATWRSLGALGLCVGAAFFGAVLWLLASWGWLSASNHLALTWLVLLIVACLLTVGLCWGLVRARVSGQAVIEEVQR